MSILQSQVTLALLAPSHLNPQAWSAVGVGEEAPIQDAACRPRAPTGSLADPAPARPCHSRQKTFVLTLSFVLRVKLMSDTRSKETL